MRPTLFFIVTLLSLTALVCGCDFRLTYTIPCKETQTDFCKKFGTACKNVSKGKGTELCEKWRTIYCHQLNKSSSNPCDVLHDWTDKVAKKLGASY
ncbi:hypothetical protein BC936DRAFT_145419 [Jimgerdemannia flammicorona]|uniref:Uncharacterized protein n=2 Tax=Jimgerdemannia flammicorona TaxID=994334 RepID=A0A433DNC0_9FUNG|nr:hypothetical protein BC936DRAFT_145419 [Jimgerdemannia flammicorona]RUS34442.1 hypothetical protein BC938DRAFT_480360 [Jimgerdemannia flammicorona]